METLQKKSLFWDVDTQIMDKEQNKRFIVERILARGDVDDFRFALETYGQDMLKKIFLKARTLDRKSLAFWCAYFNIDKKQCTEKPSLLKQVAFWKK